MGGVFALVIEYGLVAVGEDWKVDEPKPVGFSRLYYVMSGEVYYDDGHSVMELKNGHLYFFPSTISYKISHNPANPLKCLFLHLILTSNIINNLIEMPIEEDSFLFHLLSALKYAVIDNNNILINEISDILEIYCSQKNIIEKSLPISVENILAYISLNFRKEITLNELSKIAGYRKEYFIRQFKRYCGVSPYQYIKNMRLNEAVKALNKDMTVIEAASFAGYTDIKNFGRAFKKKYGVTASAWKKQYRPLP